MGDRRQLMIEITFDKNGVTNAKMWKNEPGRTPYAIKVGSAMCHPDYKFDPQIGAMIAMARMFGDEVEFKSEKEEPERKLTDFEKDALKKGYTLVRDRLPSCTAYDGRYYVIVGNGCGGGGLYWSHKFQSFSSLDHDKDEHSNAKDGEIAREIWMDNTAKGSVIAWKPQPDAVEQKALDEGYTLCRDRYPDKSGCYEVMTENGWVWHDLPWDGDHFGTCASLWMNKRDNPAIAWKEHE